MATVLALVACGDSPTTISRSRCEAQPGFVFIASGDFVAGSDEAERAMAYRLSAQALGDDPKAVAAAEVSLRQQGWFDREPQRRSQFLAGFCMQRHLVTQADYAAFVADTGHRAPDISEADYEAQGFLVHPYETVRDYRWQDRSPPADLTNHPVVLVSYDDALAYARWQGQQDGVSYRLPTALEWEKAARGTDGRYFPWGNTWQAEATNWAGVPPQGTSAVGSFSDTSPYGVTDMAGNVFEFTSTLRQGGQESVMKGCSWDDLPGFCRAAYRHDRPVSSRHILFGFRLVLE
ncbi:sulfatase-modifying factor protein [Halomicronema hongdechloris C2206]|uniref:Sulfatase-modifying factor protein n=1 Tax=Halomicronema hongdechloris C2206 TaxID=1641165 RepID=A0A1Z3HI96_9CYAN|nr:SUMF1/EgtB/PvdO family nonheme iron enzyme [Halomicronema hongdechloris]ASC69993.1 sulfatase-modifying factor protein [Halomicronema hongdechloris C2206]